MTTATNTVTADSLRWTERSIDGRAMQIRSLDPSDRLREHDFLARLSPEYRANRFIGLVKDVSEGVARELTCVDPATEVTLAAFVRVGSLEVEIGVACYRTNADGSRCDCAVTVDPAWQKLGIGGMLMRHLIDTARSRGVRRMYSAHRVEGPGAHTLAERLGFRPRPDPEDPVVNTYELELD